MKKNTVITTITKDVTKLESYIKDNIVSVKNNTYNVCVALAATKKALKDVEGEKINIIDYAQKHFNIGKSQTYSFIKLADLLDLQVNELGLPYATSSIYGTSKKDFSPTALAVLVGVEEDTVYKALKDKEISFTDTVESLKEWKKGLLAIEDKAEEPETEEPETEEPETEEPEKMLTTSYISTFGQIDMTINVGLTVEEKAELLANIISFAKSVLES